MTTKPPTDVLVEGRAKLAKPNHGMGKRNRELISGLCDEVERLCDSETFWQAEALLNHFCSEHASSKRQAGYYCTICAKPFVMSMPQGERPPKYEDLRKRLESIISLIEARAEEWERKSKATDFFTSDERREYRHKGAAARELAKQIGEIK